MTIALDGSSPTSFDLTGDGVGGATGTSASFTPPANAWIYIHIAIAVGTSRTPVYTPSNTGGGLSSWTLVDSLGSSGTQGGAVAVYRAFVNSSVATTVSLSLTNTGLSLAAVCGHVYTDVRTGANASQSGAAVTDGYSTTQNFSPTLTTTATGSEVVGIFNDESANGNPTSTDTLNARTSASQSDARIYKASNSGAAGSVAVNANGAAGGTQWAYALYEILAPSALALGAQTNTWTQGTFTASSTGNAALGSQTNTWTQGTFSANTAGVTVFVPSPPQMPLLGSKTLGPLGLGGFALKFNVVVAFNPAVSAGIGAQTNTWTQGTFTAGSTGGAALGSQTNTWTQGAFTASSTGAATLGSQTNTWTQGTFTAGTVTLTLGSQTITWTQGSMSIAGGTPGNYVKANMTFNLMGFGAVGT